MDVSIIIVNYNTSKLINDCIESIFRLVTDIDYEIIIVDNNTENLSQVIKAHDDHRIKLLQLPENVGFGRANNAGAEIATGRNLFLLNPDTILLNNAVKILSDYLDSHPECGVCGGNLFDAEMNPTSSYRRHLPGLFSEVDNFLHNIPEKLRYKENIIVNLSGKPLKVGYIIGADLMIKKSVFSKLKGFSPCFFMYYEETDLCARLSRMKLDVISVPYAKIQHLEGKSFPDSRNIKRLYLSESSRKLYMKRNISLINRIACDAVYCLYLLSRTLFSSSKPGRCSCKSRMKLLLGLTNYNHQQS